MTRSYRSVLSLILALLLSEAYTQDEKSWMDGDPLFTRLAVTENVVAGEDIKLSAIDAVDGGRDSLNLVLDGIDWRWPQALVALNLPEDVDFRLVGGQPLYLVTDAREKRVFEINASTSQQIWSLSGNGLDWPVDAHGFEEGGNFKVLVTDRVSNKVLIYNTDNATVEWTYGGEERLLSDPADAVYDPESGQVIIADKGHDRVVIINLAGEELWSLGSDSLDAPVDVELLPSKNEILITDQDNHRVIIVERESRAIRWSFPPPGSDVQLSSPVDADLLENGNVLISDSGNERLLEVDSKGQLVWRFRRALPGLRDADRLPDNRHLAVFSGTQPTRSEVYRLGFSDSTLISDSQIVDLGREVVFDSIYWEWSGDAAATGVALQLRTANTLGTLQSADWMGEDGANSYYTSPGAALHPSHNGSRFYQFAASLTTSDPTETPVLHRLWISYHYYDTATEGRFRSQAVRSRQTDLLARWKRLVLNTRPPADPLRREKVELAVYFVAPDNPAVVLSGPFTADPARARQEFDLSSAGGLAGVQTFALQGIVSSSDPSVTPVLEDWGVAWEAVSQASSNIRFLDRRGEEAPYYRVSTVLPAQEQMVDSVDVELHDPDQRPFNESLSVSLNAVLSGDEENLIVSAVDQENYRLQHKMPMRVAESAVEYNQIVEVMDRDTLFVRYEDPAVPADISVDRVVVIKNSAGDLSIEDENGVLLSRVEIGSQLYLRVREEMDRNIRPAKRDSIHVDLYDRVTLDEERVLLLEVADRNGNWDSGEFFDSLGVVIEQSNNGVPGDGVIQSIPGHRITAEYSDNIILIESVLIPGRGDTTVNIYLGGAPYIAQVGPNPYYEQEHDALRLRVASATGALYIRRLEIYNLAGELVREIDGNSLAFDTGLFIPKERYGIASGWWDLSNENRKPAGSGTYFLKVHADLEQQDNGSTQPVAFIRKFVIVR